MGGIFVSYRNGAHAVTVGALVNLLDRYFGAGQVFVDHRMVAGVRYPDELRERLLDSDVVVVVIHAGWVGEFDQPRHKDWVRYEVATALEHGKAVVPVLLGTADPPLFDQLPEDVARLTERQFARVRAATFQEDVEHLVRLFERDIAPADVPPPAPRAAAKPKRVGRQVAAWGVGLFLLTPVVLFDGGPWWRVFMSAAFQSTVFLGVVSIVLSTVFPLVKRLSYRWDVRANTMSLREALGRRWLILAVVLLPFVFMLVKSGTGSDDTWQEWEAWFTVLLVMVLAFVVQRTWQHYRARDHVWPPPVSTEPVDFRRAAYRLHEKLTTEPDWQSPRPRVVQRDAVSVYLSLAAVRLELRVRAAAPLSTWVGAGYSGQTAVCLGWLASILGLGAVGMAVAPLASVTASVYLVTAVSMVAALVFTSVKTLTDFYSERREVRRWIGELTEWQARLGPLIFCY